MKYRNFHKKWWLIASGIMILLIVFFLVVDVGQAVNLLLQANWRVWLAGAASLLVGYAFNTMRWRYLLSGKPGWVSLFYGDSIAYMGNMVTPVPTVVSRIFTTDQVTSASGTQATSAMVINTLLETMMRLIATMFALTLLATRNSEATSTIFTNLGIIIFGIGGLIWVIKHQALVVDKLARWLSRFPRLSEDRIRKTVGTLLQNLAYAGSTSHLMVGLIISIVMWIFFLVFQYLALTALQPPPTHIDRQILLTALVVLIIIPPSTTAMVGLYHSIVIGALVGFRLLDITAATAYAILLHLPQLAFWLLAGTLALNRTDIKYKQLLEAVRTAPEKDQQSLKAEDSSDSQEQNTLADV